MKILFVHQNFPGQYRWLAETLARDARWEVAALGDAATLKQRGAVLPGVKTGAYAAPRPASPQTHHYVKPFEGAVRRGQAVVRACLELQKRGFTPDVIYAHPGWGEALFLKDVFPRARLTLYCEFFYHARGYDVGFDPEFPATLDDIYRVRAKNAAISLSLSAADGGISPTRWQREAHPPEYRDRIALVHEGVDTDTVRPDTKAKLALPEHGLELAASDEVITYVARNLEPYRGFHSFMRALPQILRRRPRARVLVIGADGVSYGTPLPKGQTYKEKYLKEIGNALDLERVHFLGQVSYDTLRQAYQVSSAHVYLTYPFVLSWSLLEAMAAGCCVIGSRTAPVEEVIADGENGLLTDFFDPAAIAARVEEALEQGPKLGRLREQARQTVVERFDLKRVCLPRHLELLDKQ